MPNLDGSPITKYQPNHPYHHYFDNLPINDIEKQIFLVNAQVDINQTAIEGALGSTGSLASRLNKSLEDDGALKSTAIDTAAHKISSHADEGGFVKMTDAERAKLSLIENNSNNLSIQIEVSPTPLTWPDVSDTLTVSNSDSITWRYDSGNIYADTTFAVSLITNPSYDITPVSVSSTLYKTSSSNTEYKSGTLRVYINGLRIPKSGTIESFSYTETNPATGQFTLNQALSLGDVIRIDFDQPIV